MAFILENLFVAAGGFPGDTRFITYNANNDTLATITTAGYFDAAVNQLKVGDRLYITVASTNAITNLSLTGLVTAITPSVAVGAGQVTVSFGSTMLLTAAMNDIAAAETIYIPAPPVGIITQVFGVQFSAITVASSVITFSIGATAITGGTLTITTSGVAGQMWTATPTALNITDGTSVIKIVSDGGGTTTARGIFGIKLITGGVI